MLITLKILQLIIKLIQKKIIMNKIMKNQLIPINIVYNLK